ncbi:hypothetical protein COCSUDRAFT_39384 [Coccomyxa subellipsoidea C-169]|uniref:Uncharacterized protein n=1 Tax=Coccomyxa subellipsoidea (strain C-169) TaxID=574566 RepID=I0ZAZ7_COCSC|nr:hypothetical protein COCSUDRAFT_39384 [Coccomyxa subellipsoidea C-169]EIE27816.1 hypothetical protein COCSUDRAFT_39384 [Coccomyxa subellipsoidea C-169]|eukprot:XP_005652360.1 hypothetical protein COCSUDRAFT_39384 [Coccomyxa subellipsoidea C-169]
MASSASPSSAQPVERELQAAIAEIPASASSLLAAAQESARAQAALKATQDDSARTAAKTVLAVAAQPAQDSEVADAARAPAGEAGTQLEALPVLEAKEIEEATLAGAREMTAAPLAAPVAAAAVSAAPAVPVAKAPETPAQPATLQQRGEAIFDLAAETARRMQVQYEAKVAAIKAEGERRKEEELRRRQQRYATIDRLQAAAANQAKLPADTFQESSQGPLARLMGLLFALWAWLKERFGSLFTHTSNSSSAASA